MFTIVPIQAAGLDGVSMDRILQLEGIKSYVVTPDSMSASHRWRWEKSDRRWRVLFRLLLSYKHGKPGGVRYSQWDNTRRGKILRYLAGTQNLDR